MQFLGSHCKIAWSYQWLSPLHYVFNFKSRPHYSSLTHNIELMDVQMNMMQPLVIMSCHITNDVMPVDVVIFFNCTIFFGWLQLAIKSFFKQEEI